MIKKMKAVTRQKYGGPEVLSIREVEMPVPGDHEVLIRVSATTVNRTDQAILRGKPWIMRLFTGWIKPKSPIPGTDFAGTIEATGKSVTSFKVGDQVWGFSDLGIRSQAGYLTIREDRAISTMPDQFSFAQMAASLEGAHYAYYFLNKVPLKSGQRVLVNGATGAIGSALVQFLNAAGLLVTAVCNTKNIALIKSFGVEKVIDYTKEDFTRQEGSYDFIFDAVGKSTFGKCKHLLTATGIYISSELGPWMQNPILAMVGAFSGGRKVIFPVPGDIKQSMAFVRDLLDKGKFQPVIDRIYPMSQIADAYHYVATGQKTGNVIITFQNQN